MTVFLLFDHNHHSFVLQVGTTSIDILNVANPSHSIAYGVIAGILSYLILNGLPWVVRKLTNDYIVPPNMENSEEWSIPPGGMIPPWM